MLNRINTVVEGEHISVDSQTLNEKYIELMIVNSRSIKSALMNKSQVAMLILLLEQRLREMP